MKIAIMQINKNKAVALDNQGAFHVIPNADYAVGQELTVTELFLKQQEKRAGGAKKSVARIAVAAAAVLLVVGAGGGVAYAAPVSTVTVSGSEDVEYKVNVFGRVVQASVTEGSDRDVEASKALLTETKGRRIEDVMNLAFERMEEKPDVVVSGRLERREEFNREINERLEGWDSDKPAFPEGTTQQTEPNSTEPGATENTGEKPGTNPEGGVPKDPGTGDAPSTNPGADPGVDSGMNPGAEPGASTETVPGGNATEAMPTEPASTDSGINPQNPGGETQNNPPFDPGQGV